MTQSTDILMAASQDSNDQSTLSQVPKLEATTVQVKPTPPPAEAVTIPDGGAGAWLAAFGSMCTGFTILGMIVSWGVFQTFYELELLSHESPSTIAWIGSLQLAFIFMPGFFMGRVFDLGHFRIPLFVASFLYVASYFISAQCTKYYQLLLSQGVLAGLSSGCLFAPMLAMLNHWFAKRRSLAYALVGVGGSVGGLVLPIVTRIMLQSSLGFPWTMRILGFVFIGTFTVANLTMRTRLPPNPERAQIPFSAFKTPAYTIYIASATCIWLGIYTPLTYLALSGINSGLSADLSFYLIPIVNGVSGIGRLISGFLAVKYGPLNVFIPANIVAFIMIYAWPFCTSAASLIIFSIIYGFSTGIFMALLPAPIPRMGDLRTAGARVGLSMTLMSVGIIGSFPISGAIETAAGSFREPAYWAGSIVAVGVLLSIIARWYALDRRWVGKI